MFCKGISSWIFFLLQISWFFLSQVSRANTSPFPPTPLPIARSLFQVYFNPNTGKEEAEKIQTDLIQLIRDGFKGETAITMILDTLLQQRAFLRPPARSTSPELLFHSQSVWPPQPALEEVDLQFENRLDWAFKYLLTVVKKSTSANKDKDEGDGGGEGESKTNEKGKSKNKNKKELSAFGRLKIHEKASELLQLIEPADGQESERTRYLEMIFDELRLWRTGDMGYIIRRLEKTAFFSRYFLVVHKQLLYLSDTQMKNLEEHLRRVEDEMKLMSYALLIQRNRLKPDELVDMLVRASAMFAQLAIEFIKETTDRTPVDRLYRAMYSRAIEYFQRMEPDQIARALFKAKTRVEKETSPGKTQSWQLAFLRDLPINFGQDSWRDLGAEPDDENGIFSQNYLQEYVEGRGSPVESDPDLPLDDLNNVVPLNVTFKQRPLAVPSCRLVHPSVPTSRPPDLTPNHTPGE
ncbi:MAG: hypothetical protein C5B49_00915 [Bdellovibrio sp.]|nr:MAG: hypothetical protein C5B49_00915 [Bdellovibrio sp.]